jgi:hypothetical protein
MPRFPMWKILYVGGQTFFKVRKLQIRKFLWCVCPHIRILYNYNSVSKQFPAEGICRICAFFVSPSVPKLFYGPCAGTCLNWSRTMCLSIKTSRIQTPLSKSCIYLTHNFGDQVTGQHTVIKCCSKHRRLDFWIVFHMVYFSSSKTICILHIIDRTLEQLLARKVLGPGDPPCWPGWCEMLSQRGMTHRGESARDPVN